MPPVSATRSMGQRREPRLRSGNSVLEQHRDRQRADPAGHRRQRAGDLRDRRVHVADDDRAAAVEVCEPRRSRLEQPRAPSRRSVTGRDPDVDDRGARLDECRRDEPRPADRRDENVGRRRDRGEIRRLRVADRDRRVALEQQHRHRLSDDLAAADDDRVRARDRDRRSGSSISITPDGVHGIRCARPCTSRPTLTGWKPSTSLAGSIASKTCCAAPFPIAAGSGDCTRMPSCTSLAFSRVDERQQLVRASRRRAAAGDRPTDPTRSRRAPCCARRSRMPDPRRPARCPSPGGRPERAVNA